jgi:hypothetical protein
MKKVYFKIKYKLKIYGRFAKNIYSMMIKKIINLLSRHYEFHITFLR